MSLFHLTSIIGYPGALLGSRPAGIFKRARYPVLYFKHDLSTSHLFAETPALRHVTNCEQCAFCNFHFIIVLMQVCFIESNGAIPSTCALVLNVIVLYGFPLSLVFLCLLFNATNAGIPYHTEGITFSVKKRIC